MEDDELNIHEYIEDGIYCCKCCKYNTTNKYNFERHIVSDKHTHKEQLYDEVKEKFECECGYYTISRTSYWRHKKQCTYENENHQNFRKSNHSSSSSISSTNTIYYTMNDLQDIESKEQTNTIDNQHISYHSNSASSIYSNDNDNDDITSYDSSNVSKIYDTSESNSNIEDGNESDDTTTTNYSSSSKEDEKHNHMEEKISLMDIANQQNISIDTMKDLFMSILSSQNKLEDLIVKQSKETTHIKKKIRKIEKQPRTLVKQRNTFNLNTFLNVDCKNAMNFTDFIKQIKVGRKELDCIYENGFVKSFDIVVMKELRNMDQTERPIHCVDEKRKKFVCKINDIWDRSDVDNKVRDAIIDYSTKQAKEHLKWKNENPDWNDNDDKFEFCMLTNKEIYIPYSRFHKDKINAKILNEFAKLVIDKEIVKERNAKKNKHRKRDKQKKDYTNSSTSQSVNTSYSGI